MIVDDEHIIERVEVEERELAQDPPGVHIKYNQTDPHLIRDGVDFIAVIDEGEGRYRVDFWGYVFGRLYVTEEGVQELGQRLTADEGRIPSWLLDPGTVDAGDVPGWVPDSVDIEPTVTCDNCAKTVGVQNVVTPRNHAESGDRAVLCRECWEQYQ